MKKNFEINYECLVYNLPIKNESELFNHKFLHIPLDDEIIKSIVPNEQELLVNYGALSCIHNVNGKKIIVKVINQEKIILNCEEETVIKEAEKIIKDRINNLEQYLIFTTNLHIFIPAISYTITFADNTKKYGSYDYKPLIYGGWSFRDEKIDLDKRLHFVIDFNEFLKFKEDKKHSRYKLAFKYYIDSFYEYNISIAFCMLCSALDAITGCNNSNKTKERLAKYSSVLFCKPLQKDELYNKMKKFYSKRSKYVHGKKIEILKEEEIELRELVRWFLLGYLLFWNEMKISREQQMLQKLDEIYENQKLYIKYVPASYGFIRLSLLHESKEEGIFPLERNNMIQQIYKMLGETVGLSNKDETEKFIKQTLIQNK